MKATLTLTIEIDDVDQTIFAEGEVRHIDSEQRELVCPVIFDGTRYNEYGQATPFKSMIGKFNQENLEQRVNLIFRDKLKIEDNQIKLIK